MVEVLRPADADQLREAIAWATAEETALEIVGGGGKRGLGRPLMTEYRLDCSALAGIVAYEPEELVLTIRPGTPLAEIAAALAAERQQLAFEPPDLGPLYGAQAGMGSIGGVIACNLSGPRRIKAGAARDHFLGVAAVTGRGEEIKAGGKVVKNVTGYDLCKLFAGAHGTLAALTEITLKVLPAPEKTRTVLVFGLDDATAIRALTAALASPNEVSGAAHLPAAAAARSGVAYVAGAGAAVTAARVEGPARSTAHRCAELRALLGRFGPVEELHGRNSGLLWAEVGDVAPLLGAGDRVIWRLSVPPAEGAEVVARIATDCEALYDWGGGLIWLALAPLDDGGAALLRGAIAGGHATLMRGAAELRTRVPVFHPQPAPLAALSARIKQGFDPRRVLNPGRMYQGV